MGRVFTFFVLIRKEEVTCGAWIHSVPSDGLALALADACSVLVPGHDRGGHMSLLRL